MYLQYSYQPLVATEDDILAIYGSQVITLNESRVILDSEDYDEVDFDSVENQFVATKGGTVKFIDLEGDITDELTFTSEVEGVNLIKGVIILADSEHSFRNSREHWLEHNVIINGNPPFTSISVLGVDIVTDTFFVFQDGLVYVEKNRLHCLDDFKRESIEFTGMAKHITMDAKYIYLVTVHKGVDSFNCFKRDSLELLYSKEHRGVLKLVANYEGVLISETYFKYEKVFKVNGPEIEIKYS